MSLVSSVHRAVLAAAFAAIVGPGLATAQQAAPPAAAAPAPSPTPAPQAADADAAKPAPLVVYFELGSATVRAQDLAVLDKASRLYSEAKPLVMIVSGGTDAVGPAEANLILSQRRAEAVLRGLVARGIPADRFQVLAKGETEPSIAAPTGVQEPLNRRVEIAWR